MRDARTLGLSPRGSGETSRTDGFLSVAYFCPDWPPGNMSNGVVTYVGTLTDEMRVQGHTTTVITPHADLDVSSDGIYSLSNEDNSRTLPGRLLDRLESRVRPDRAWQRAVCRSIVAATRRAIEERGVQILEMEESFGWPLRIQQKIPIPVVVRLHGPWFLTGSADGNPLDAVMRHRIHAEGLAIRAADGVTAPSRDVVEKAGSYYGMAIEHAEVIPNPVPNVSASEGWDPSSFDSRVILFIGRFDLIKGGDIIINAFAKVIERIPRARLLFVGLDQGFMGHGGKRWMVREYMDDIIPGARQSGQIEYLGQLPHAALAGLRRQAAVTVVCSRYETFGLTATEAMSQGCPLVATRAGALPEIIRDGWNGLLCRPDDPEDLAEKLCYILSDPSIASRLGRRAAADCRRSYNVKLLADRSADYYQRVIARAPLRRRTCRAEK